MSQEYVTTDIEPCAEVERQGRWKWHLRIADQRFAGDLGPFWLDGGDYLTERAAHRAGRRWLRKAAQKRVWRDRVREVREVRP